jgi:hypothetical protein
MRTDSCQFVWEKGGCMPNNRLFRLLTLFVAPLATFGKRFPSAK